MGAGTQDIIQQVRAATVWVADGPRPTGRLHGTGFFVAPGFVVTCAHVVAQAVEGAGASLTLWWGEQELQVSAYHLAPTGMVQARRGDYPDAAVLVVDSTDHPVVRLGEPRSEGRVWCYGSTRARTGTGGPPEPDGRRLEITLATPGRFTQLTGGRLLPGMSGGPVLDLERFAVVAVTQSTAGTAADLGGWATPIDAVLAAWTGAEDLRALNEAVDRDSLVALRRDQTPVLGGLPGLVQGWLSSQAVDRLLRYFRTNLRLSPPVMPPEDVPEWVARQLFRLNLQELVRALRNAIGGGFDYDARQVFAFVAPCLPVGAGVESLWIFPDAPAGVADELKSGVRRIVHLRTDVQTSAFLFLCRALEEVVSLVPCASAFGAVSAPNGLPGHLDIDLDAITLEGAGDDPYDDAIGDLAEYDEGTVLVVDPGDAPTRADFEQLVRAKPKVRMVVCRASLTLPPDSDDIVYAATPPFVPAVEARALQVVQLMNKELRRVRVEEFPLGVGA